MPTLQHCCSASVIAVRSPSIAAAAAPPRRAISLVPVSGAASGSASIGDKGHNHSPLARLGEFPAIGRCWRGPIGSRSTRFGRSPPLAHTEFDCAEKSHQARLYPLNSA